MASSSMYLIPYLMVGITAFFTLKNKSIGLFVIVYVVLLIYYSGFEYFVICFAFLFIGCIYYLIYKGKFSEYRLRDKIIFMIIGLTSIISILVFLF
jgi:hypothetical protein